MTPAFCLRQFVDLRRHDVTIYAEAFQPVPRGPVAVEAGVTAVDQHERAAKSRVADAGAEIRGGQRVELFARLVAAPRVPEPGQVHQVKRRTRLSNDPIKICQACLAGRGARAGQLLPDERVNQGRLADVGPAHHCKFRQAVLGKPFGSSGASDKLCDYFQTASQAGPGSRLFDVSELWRPTLRRNPPSPASAESASADPRARSSALHPCG